MAVAEPKPAPKLTLVDEAFAALPPPADDAKAQQIREGERKIVARYAPSVLGVAKRRWEAELHRSLGGYTIEQLKARGLYQDAHEAELDRVKAERIDLLKDAKWHGRFQGTAIAAIVLVPLAVFGMWGVMTLTRMDVIAAQRVQNTQAWQPPHEEHERDVPRLP